MATWEDGPEYAPLEPPAEFTVPDTPPLSVAEPPEEPPAAPAERPRFGEPQDRVVPLATLVPQAGGEPRDPHSPFEVDSDAMTQSGSGGAWGAAHWRPPSGPPAGTPAAGPWGPPTGTPVGRPTDPMALRSGPPSPSGGLPAPGTPAWFGPGPAAPPREQPPPTLFRATPPGAIIVLALSIFWVVAPPAFLLALILSTRARYARGKILTAFAVVGAVVLLIPTIGTFASGYLGGWYSLLSTWSLLGSLLMIVLILVLVNTEIKNQRGGPGGYQQQPLPPTPYDQQRHDQQRHDQQGHDQHRYDQQQWPPPGQ